MVIYIKELENDNELNIINIETKNELLKKVIHLINKLVIKFIKKFDIHTIKKIDDNSNSNNIIYIMQDIKKENKNIKKQEKILNKLYQNINRLIVKYPDTKIYIVLSKKLKKYKNQLQNYNIISGKQIQLYLLENIINYIMNTINEKIEKQDIYFIINKYNEKINDKIFNNIIEKVKTVNIVTNELAKYKKIEEKLYNDKSILITVANNRKKSLKKANIIINVDMDNNNISKYIINRNAIIINLSDNILSLKAFDGIIINNQEIIIDEERCEYFIRNKIYNNFELSELYESIFDNKSNIEDDKVQIINLIGNNGIIDKKELLNSKKFLTN